MRFGILFLCSVVESSLHSVAPAKSQPDLQKCLVQIASKHFKSDAFVVEINLDRDLEHFSLISWLAVVQVNPYNKCSILLRPQAYVILVSEQEIDKLLYTLYRSTFWNPRAKFVIVYKGKVGRVFEKTVHYYMLNTVVLIERSLENFDIFSYFPYNGLNNGTDAVLVGKCVGGFLTHDNDLFPNKIPSSWENFTIKYSANLFYPYVFCLNCAVQGIEIRVLILLQYLLGFKLEVSILNEAERGLIDQDGNWNGLYGQVQDRNVDLIIGGFSGSYQNYWQFDLLFPCVQDEAVWLVPVARKVEHWKNIIQIFQVSVWVFLLGSVLYASLTMWFVGKLTEMEIVCK